MTERSARLLSLLESGIYMDYKADEALLSLEDVYNHILHTSERVRFFVEQINNEIISWLNPALAEPSLLTPSGEAELFELAQALFQPIKHIDTNLALNIYTALVDYARSRGNEDALIKYLYWKGLSMFYLNKNFYNSEMLDTFTEAASFRARYKEFACNTTREYINRALGNVYVTLSSFRSNIGVEPALAAMDTAMAFWTNPDIRAFDPEMKWEQFIYSIHQNTCSMLDVLRTRYREDRELAQRVYESAMYIYKRQKEYFSETTISYASSIPEYNLTCAKYHAGRISARACADKLIAMSNDVREGDYSLDATHRKTHMSIAGLHYLGEDPTYPKDKLERITEEIMKSIVTYMSKVPRDASRFMVNSQVSMFVSGATVVVNGEKLIDIILNLTIFRHMATYVHSLMVSLIAETICAYVLDNIPLYFAGFAGAQTAADLQDKRMEIIEMARMCGLCHDVGKITDINTISVYSRKLSDGEFQIISTHPDNGYDLLRTVDFKGLADVARGHHKWYDGSKGYPSGYDHRTSQYRPLIDMISVCDSIEAATDTLGRPYAKGKSLSEVVNEIINEAGTHYNPLIANALKDPELFYAIDELLKVKRPEAYYNAYMKVYSE